MKFSKPFYILSTVMSVLVSSSTYADTCYDPNYDSYYNCSGDEYIAPVVSGALFGTIISNDNNNGYYNHEHYNRYGNHGYYNNGHYNSGYGNHGHYNNYNNGKHGGSHGYGGHRH